MAESFSQTWNTEQIKAYKNIPLKNSKNLKKKAENGGDPIRGGNRQINAPVYLLYPDNQVTDYLDTDQLINKKK